MYLPDEGYSGRDTPVGRYVNQLLQLSMTEALSDFEGSDLRRGGWANGQVWMRYERARSGERMQKCLLHYNTVCDMPCDANWVASAGPWECE